MVKQKSAYTLVEILVVVAIMALITTMGVVDFRQGENNSNLQLQTENIINVFRDLQIKAMNNVSYQSQVPIGGYGWLVNDYDANHLTKSFSTFIRTQNTSGPYTASIDSIIASTAMPANFYLLPGGVLTLNFKPQNGSVETYFSNGSSASSSVIGVAYTKVGDHYFNVLINNQSGIITSQIVNQPINWSSFGL